MSTRSSKRAQGNLHARIEAWHRLPDTLKSAYHKPGSTNPKKQR